MHLSIPSLRSGSRTPDYFRKYTNFVDFVNFTSIFHTAPCFVIEGSQEFTFYTYGGEYILLIFQNFIVVPIFVINMNFLQTSKDLERHFRVYNNFVIIIIHIHITNIKDASLILLQVHAFQFYCT